MHALQHLPPERFLPALLCEGLSISNPPLKREQFGTGGGQFGLDGDQRRHNGLLALLRHLQP